jgi:hypothetical protein
MPLLQVGGQWTIVQTNGFRVPIHVTQTGDQLSAVASHSNGAVQSTAALVGRTKDLNNPGSESDWDSEGPIFHFA